MSFFSFSNPWWWIVTIPSIILIFLAYKYFSNILGWFGEHWAKEELSKLSKDDYKVIHNVLVEHNGYTHQIDHIVFSKFGIFVIETKQYNGFFTGDKYDKQWVRHLKRKKIYYENPIRQNYGHVMTIIELLNIDKKDVHNLVYIPSKAKLKINNAPELLRYGQLINKIYQYTDVVIDNVDELYDELKRINIKDKKIRKQHINSIKKPGINSMTNCPKCGGELIKRNGKYGEYLGCSNYPKCRYTRNIKRDS